MSTERSPQRGAALAVAAPMAPVMRRLSSYSWLLVVSFTIIVVAQLALTVGVAAWAFPHLLLPAQMAGPAGWVIDAVGFVVTAYVGYRAFRAAVAGEREFTS